MKARFPARTGSNRSETLQNLRKNKKFPTIWCSGCGIGVVMGSLDPRHRPPRSRKRPGGPGGGHRLHRAHAGLHGFQHPAHHPRTCPGICHRLEDRPPRNEGHCHHGRRRCAGDWRQPLHPCRPAQHRDHRPGGQQCHLRHDRRTVQPDDASRYARHHRTLRERRTAFPDLRPGGRGRRDLCRRAARSTIALELDKYLAQAIAKDGFSLVEAVSYCHTTFGRINKLGTAADMMRALKDNSISKSAYDKLTDEEQAPIRRSCAGSCIPRTARNTQRSMPRWWIASMKKPFRPRNAGGN